MNNFQTFIRLLSAKFLVRVVLVHLVLVLLVFLVTGVKQSQLLSLKT